MRRKNIGFSLIEMAIVLVIITTVLTLGLGTLTTVFSSANYSETRKRQDRIKDALIAFMGANRRLPCPASGNPDGDLATNDITGLEVPWNPTAGCTPAFGIVPYATLGLGREVAEDGWQNYFSYQIAADNPSAACPGPGVDWANKQCFGAGKVGNLTIADDSAATPIAQRVVAVIVSHGPNGLGAWTRQGTQNAPPLLVLPLCEEAYNARLSTLSGCTPVTSTFYKGERTGNDDVVAYLMAGDILQPLAKQGAILSATAQVTAHLEYLKYLALSQKTNCSDTFTIPLADLEGNPLFDPWGHAYALAPLTGNSCSITFSGGTPPKSISITLAEFCKLAGIGCPP